VRTTEDSTLILLLIAVSLAFAWILWPFYGAILWAIVFATVFAPAHRRLLATIVIMAGTQDRVVNVKRPRRLHEEIQHPSCGCSLGLGTCCTTHFRRRSRKR
jgi:hypothetical protein